MPILLEKPTDKSKTRFAPAIVLRARHRWERWRGVLFACLIGLAVTLGAVVAFRFVEHAPMHRGILGLIWSGGVLLTLLAAAIAWRFAPASLAVTAQIMDRRLSAKNRLEAAAALHGSPTLLARAQREETAAYLGDDPRLRPVRILPWLVVAVLIAVLSHLLVLAVWTRPAPPPSAAPAPPPPAPVLPHASIVWRSPIPESKANPVEEVPTVAVAQSTTGLRNLTLEISVNGEPKPSVPIPAEPFDHPGKNTLKVSLYMDELNVEAFDVVSYYLRGQRIAPGEKIPDTASSIQFIQVRPFREDFGQGPAMSKAVKKGYDLLLELKLAQLRAMKENFILAHTDLPVTDPLRMKENDRVGQNQGLLSSKTEEIVQDFIQLGAPAPIIDLLRQAEPPMDDASKKILAIQNAAALPPQGKALDFIIQVEKFIIHGVPDKPPPGSPPDKDDPFKDKQKHDLTKRFQTAAGQLEQLVKNQTKLANDLNQTDPSGQKSFPANQNSTPQPTPGTDTPNGQTSPAPSAPAPDTADDGSGKEVPLPPAQALDPFGPDSGTGSYSERQTRVVQGVEALQSTNKVLPPAVNTALQSAQDHGLGSLRLLDQHDEAGAREPAAAAADDLQRAYTSMINAGVDQTKVAMEQAQRQLNDLGQQMRDLAQKAAPGSKPPELADTANKLHDVQKQLNDAADQQQATGSAEGAEELNHLANQISNQNIARDLGGLDKNGFDPKQALSIAQRLEDLAGQAAAGQAPAPGEKPSAREYARMINALEASQTNLAHLAAMAGVAGPTSTAASGQVGAKPENKAPGTGQNPGAPPGQGQAPKPGTPSDIPTPGQNPSDQPGQGQGQGQGSARPGVDSGAVRAALREVVADLKNQTQQVSVVVPSVNTGEMQHQLRDLAGTDYQAGDTSNLVRAYQALAPPLDKLITELRAVAVRTEREDVVEQPDLDEAPRLYRPAVSDYFETLSRNYHPDRADMDDKKQ